MEASAIHAPAAVGKRPLGLPLLRLRSDEQLLAAFRSGNDDAFRVLHDRYRQRLFAYVRQMLSAGSRQDAEDVLQDVFVRAYGALRNDGREMNVRAWLYRVAHNRCIDHLRRPIPPAAEVFEMSRKPLHDPIEEAQRRDDLRRLVEDVGRLPDQQRSALLMREIDGMSYANLAAALDVTVPAVKSLLVRARVGLVEAQEARDADCSEIRADLLRAYDKGVKASGHARRHMRTCDGCQEYRTALRGMKRSFAALSPLGAGPLAFAAKLVGLGGGGAAASGGAAAAGAGSVSGAALTSGGLATVTACKVAAVVCTAVVATGGAVEVNREISSSPPAAAHAHAHASRSSVKHSAAARAARRSAAVASAAAVVHAPAARTVALVSAPAAPATSGARHAAAPAKSKSKHAKHKVKAHAPAPAPVSLDGTATAPDDDSVQTSPPQTTDDSSASTGGAVAPDASVAPSATSTPDATATAPDGAAAPVPISAAPQPTPPPAVAQSGPQPDPSTGSGTGATAAPTATATTAAAATASPAAGG